MSGASVLDLNEVVDGQKLGRASLAFFTVAMLTFISDGFDLAAMGYIAPELTREWHIAPARLVPAFSAAIIGMMIGGPVMGFLGDRYGRKRVIFGGLCAIGLTTLVTMATHGIADLVLLRFLTGLGLGGVIPNVVALVAEVVPRRVRGRLIIVVSLGIVIGIAMPGFVAAALVPRFGWRVLLLVGGVLPLLVALASLVYVPESIKYLMERGDRQAEVRRLARTLRPDLPIGDDTGFTLPAAAPGGRRGSIKPLFAGDLALVTPLLWICQAANQMANFFSLTWLPTLLQASGASATAASVSASLFSIGGLVGGLVLLFIIDRLGVIPLVLLFLAGTPLVAAMAVADLSPSAHALVIAGAGLCVTGVQLGITALLGIFYPTPVRSLGTGWTQAAGRLGALAAPIVGGILLDMHIPMRRLPLAPAILLAVGFVACAALALLCVRRFGGLHPDEFTATPPSRDAAPGLADAAPGLTGG